MIHQYKNNGYNIVLDVNSGSVHVVDDVVYDVIPVLEKLLAGKLPKEEQEQAVLSELKDNYSEKDLKEALSEVWELKEAGMLYTEDIYENYIIDFKREKR